VKWAGRVRRIDLAAPQIRLQIEHCADDRELHGVLECDRPAIEADGVAIHVERNDRRLRQFAQLAAVAGDEPRETTSRPPEVFEGVAQRNEGNFGQFDDGGGREMDRLAAIRPAQHVARRFPRREVEGWIQPLVERGVDEHMREPVGLAADEGHRGVEQRAHRLATAGDGGDEAGVGVGSDGAHLFEDEVGGRIVVRAGAQVVEAAGAAVGAGGPGDDARILEGEQAVGVGAAGEERVPQSLPGRAAGKGRRRGEQFGLQASRANGGGDDDDAGWQDGWVFAGERPDGFGQDGGGLAGDGDEDGGTRSGAGYRRTELAAGAARHGELTRG